MDLKLMDLFYLAWLNTARVMSMLKRHIVERRRHELGLTFLITDFSAT